MYTKRNTGQKWALASVGLQDAYTDFILSRQAILCSQQTISWYGFTTGRFVKWLSEVDLHEPSQITSRHVRAYLANLVECGLKDSSVNGHARAIKTFLKFLFTEKFIGEEPKFLMPVIARQRLSVLTSSELKIVLQSCKTSRDLALVMVLVDTGMRRAEICQINWGDIDIASGVVTIQRGKGGKSRSVVIGIKTRRTILKYRREVEHLSEKPLFQTLPGKRFTKNGIRSLLLRIGIKANLKLTPHTLRRTFATLSLRAGMNPLHLQGLLGHASLEMTERYVQMIDDDLVQAHKKHGPIDNL